jgi:hypothetical protein
MSSSAIRLERNSALRKRDIAVPIGLVVALALAVAGARRASPSAVSPVSPSGEPWHAFWTWGVVAAFALYVVGAYRARGGAFSLRAALVVTVVVQTIALAAPLILSNDVFLYWSESRIVVVHHANPYTRTPGDYPNDPARARVSEIWQTATEQYGPAWAVTGTVPTTVSGTSAHRAQLAYRIFAVLGILTAVAIVARRTRNPAAVALLGWSPLVALHFAGGGHNDAWMTALLVFAVATPTTATGGVAWSLSGAFKPLAAVLLPLQLVARRFRAPRGWWIGLVGAAAFVAVAATAAFGTHWVSGATSGARLSSPLGGVHWLSQLGIRHRYAVGIAGLVFAAVYVVLLRVAWRTGRARLSIAATALCLTSSLLRPWYALWPLALAAIEVDELAAVAAILLSGYVLFADAVSF